MADANNNKPVRAVVAMDARGLCKGALEFCAWMQSHLAQQWSVSGAHVISPSQMGDVRVPDEYKDLQFLAKHAMQKVVDSVGTSLDLKETAMLDEGSIETAIQSYTLSQNADMLVLGRAAPSNEDRFVRLGPVARRILRKLPCPVTVVPPDLTADKIGKGPVLLPVDGTDSSLGAFRRGQELADRLGRELVLVHVADSPTLWGYEFVSPAAIEAMTSDLHTTAIRNIERWLQEHALGGHRLVVRQGVVAHEVSILAQELGACMIVTGSRELSTTERIFVTSVGSELAASAKTAVMVVPSR